MSLVASIAAVSFCFVGSILGIVFGHIARSRIRRTGDQGSGLALAGLVTGYVGLGLVVAFAAVIGVVLAVLISRGDSSAADSARRLDRGIVELAVARNANPRNAVVIRRELDHWSRFDGDEVTVGSTGRNAAGANDAELNASGWRLNVSGDFGEACLAVPGVAISRSRDVTEGSCGGGD